MGTDNFFKNRQAKLKERKQGERTPKPNSFLIVSEGTKTEPNYFSGLAKYINSKYGDSISSKPTIEPRGEGRCTVSLVEKTAEIVSRSKIRYEHIWVVFDKDDFDDFDEAIELARKHNFKVAWSNQSFEYWIYLHFNYSDSALHRDDWVEKLSTIFKAYKIDPHGYQKNYPDIFEIVTTFGSLKSAVGNAKRVSKNYSEVDQPSNCDPCTTVHNLILALEPYLDDLLN